MDPRKNFKCVKRGHIINDSQRPFGDLSPCPICEQIDFYHGLRDGEPCEHKGCLHHITHPCEGCGRIAGKKR